MQSPCMLLPVWPLQRSLSGGHVGLDQLDRLSLGGQLQSSLAVEVLDGWVCSRLEQFPNLRSIVLGRRQQQDGVDRVAPLRQGVHAVVRALLRQATHVVEIGLDIVVAVLVTALAAHHARRL
eukprot:360774-Chlamydomonas_euryale.AAC.14